MPQATKLKTTHTRRPSHRFEDAQAGEDGIERVTTQSVFDILEIAQHSRGAGACRRLAKLLTELGWTAVRVRGLTRGGYREEVRGYCRDAHERRELRQNVMTVTS